MQDNMGTSYTDELNTSEGLLPSEVTPVLSDGDEIIDMGDDFDFGDFQVVRREFFAHLREPSITFNNCRIYVNSACLTKFPNTEYVQVLINRNTKILARAPCNEGERDSFLWCHLNRRESGNQKPDHMPSCFSPKIFDAYGVESRLPI